MADRNDQTSTGHAAAFATLQATPVCIACGTDFSEGAIHAAGVAAALAKALDEPLVLIHAANPKVRENLPEELDESICLYAQEQLQNETDRLSPFEIPMHTAFRAGEPGAVVLAESVEEHARLLVLGGTERRAARPFSSRVVEQVAESASIPSLVVRDAASLLRWLRGERRLRVMIAAPFSAAIQSTVQWVQWLRTIGPCEVIVTVLEPSPVQPSASVPYPEPFVTDLDAQSTRIQERCFRQWVHSRLGKTCVRVRFEYELGRSDAHLIRLATDERVDLMVFPSDPHDASPGRNSHPVLRGLLRYATFNLACVPVPPSEENPP
jgi:nucleotide-binding universal stress UspA family protein